MRCKNSAKLVRDPSYPRYNVLTTCASLEGRDPSKSGG